MNLVMTTGMDTRTELRSPKYLTSYSFSSIHDNRDEDGPGTKTCWQFDEVDGEYTYSNEIPDTEFGHKHNPMAMYDLNPLGQN